MLEILTPDIQRSSLPYQILLYYNSWYLALFFLVEIGVFIWKGELAWYVLIKIDSYVKYWVDIFYFEPRHCKIKNFKFYI